MATMLEIYEGSENELSDAAKPPLPPMRSCSSATTQTALLSSSVLNRRVSFVDGNQTRKSRKHIEKDYDDSSVETITSASLYSLHNYKPKKEPSFTDYLLCQASFSDLLQEVKGTWEDASSAVDQIVHAFVVSDEDIDRVSEQIEIAEKDIEVHLLQAVRDIGVQRC